MLVLHILWILVSLSLNSLPLTSFAPALCIFVNRDLHRMRPMLGFILPPTSLHPLSILSRIICNSIFLNLETAPLRGHSFMTSTKEIGFLPPVHMCPHEPDPLPLWTSTCGRHEILIALLKRLVAYNDLPDLKLKFDYMV